MYLLFFRPLPYLSLLFGFLSLSLQAQESSPLQPSNDLCNQAIHMEPGDQLYGLSNVGATTSHDETPEGQPVSCIKTFENDLWFRFTADSAYSHYEVQITPRACATPAGLQSLIVEAEACDPESFIYRACANPHAEEPLKFFLQDAHHGKNYFIYVDGYDGNVCQFDIWLIGHQGVPYSLDDHKHLQLDYDHAPPLFEPSGFSASFQNNEVSLSWEVDAQEAVLLFLVERYLKGRSPHGLVLESIEPQNTVGTGRATYTFTDRQSYYKDGETYCYRLVKVGPEQNRAYSEPICVEAKMITDFNVTQVFSNPNSKIYTVLYTNKIRQDLRFTVLTEDKESLKSMTINKSPKGSNQITVDMTEYPPGLYFLRVEGKKAKFEREFSVE